MMKFLRTCAVSTAILVSVGTAGIAQAETTLERIVRTKKVSVATEAAYPPMEFSEGGKIVGLGSDILAEVAKDLGAEVEQIDLPFQGILPGLLANKFDFVATSVAINPERAKRYAYTMPVAENSSTIIKKVGSDIEGAIGLQGKVVATQLASSMEPVARKLDEQLKSKGEGFGELKLFPSFNDCILSVGNGTADAALAPLPVINYLMSQHPGIFEIVGRAADKPTYISWVVRPDDKDLRDAINKTLKRLHDTGKMAELQQKWLKTTYPLPETDYLPEGAL